MGILISLLRKPKGHSQHQPKMISHPYPLGTLGTHHEPTSPRNTPSRSQSSRSIARRLSDRSAAGRREEEAGREGFRRLLSPSPDDQFSSPEHTEIEIKPPKSSSILTGRDDLHGAKRLRKVIRVEGDWDLIRGVDTDGYDNSGNRTCHSRIRTPKRIR